MNIVILSRGPSLYSTQSLAYAGRLRGHQMRVIDHVRCNLVVESGQPAIYYEGQRLKNIDAVIPRIGASVTFHGAAIIRQFEMLKIYTAASSDALLRSRDKLRCLQLLAMENLGVPKTIYTDFSSDAKKVIAAVGGTPLIIKLLEGTHGLGVILAETDKTAESVLDAFYKIKERVIVQEFIEESKGADVRAFVVDGKIVAAMKRKALPGEFRSNLHRGGNSIHIKLTQAEIDTALRATELLGLDVAGVDMLQSDRGPLVLEVNPSPGLEGITKTTGVDVADKILELVERKILARRRAELNI